MYELYGSCIHSIIASVYMQAPCKLFQKKTVDNYHTILLQHCLLFTFHHKNSKLEALGR